MSNYKLNKRTNLIWRWLTFSNFCEFLMRIILSFIWRGWIKEYFSRVVWRVTLFNPRLLNPWTQLVTRLRHARSRKTHFSIQIYRGLTPSNFRLKFIDLDFSFMQKNVSEPSVLQNLTYRNDFCICYTFF